MRMIVLISLLIFMGCSTENPHQLTEDSLYFELQDVDSDELQKNYESLKKRIDSNRKLYSDKSNRETESYLVTILTDSIFHYWYDTPWDFNGTTQKPREGNIACGYFVTTTLLHAGISLDRIKLAQQAASIIIRSLCNTSTIKTFTGGNFKGLNNYLKKSNDGIYIIGLDNHVGFIHKKDTSIVMIHADYINDKVNRERITDCKAILNSKFHMVGNLSGNEDLLSAWRKNEKIEMKD